MLPHTVYDHPAFAALSPYSKEVLSFLMRHRRSDYKCKVTASVRFVADGVGRSEERSHKSLRELQDAGFIVPVALG